MATEYSTSPGNVEIHNITFSGDIRLAELQILSIAHYWNIDGVSRYKIIVNDPEGPRLRDRLLSFAQARVSSEFMARMQIVTAGEEFSRFGGWQSQQYIKLHSAAAADTKWVLFLDSKNHFLKPTSIGDFFSGDRSITYFRIPSTRQQPWLTRSLEFFNQDTTDLISMPTITPYMLNRGIVNAMLSFIRESPKIGDYPIPLAAPALKNSTEFYLYYAFMRMNGWTEKFYCAGKKMGETIFTQWPQDPEVVRSYLQHAYDGRYYYLGLHRRRISGLTGEQRAQLAAIWSRIAGVEDPYYFFEP